MSRFIRPTALRLPDDEIERHATWLELFFDLIFAVIVTELATRLFHQLTYLGVLECSSLLIPVMWTWSSYTVFAARFDNCDLIHWLLTFVIMFAGVIMAIQIPVALERGATGFSIGFLISQISLLLLYARVHFDKSGPNKITSFYIIGFGLATISWIMSLFVDLPIKFIFWLLGMSIYLVIPWIGRKRILSKAPLDTIYIPERFGAFTIIILGQTVASVVYGLKFASWNYSSAITSVMAFILAIIIWSQYYRFTGIADYKCTLSSGQPYIYAHIPLIISLMIMGVCTEVFIITPTSVDQKINFIFAFGTILYLTSFYLLQYIAVRKFMIRGFSYIGAVIAISILFLAHSFPMVKMLGLVTIFTTLFGIQYWIGLKKQGKKGG